MIRALALFLLLALVAVAAPVSSRVMIPHALQVPTQYMEIVREKKDCTKECFVEYFLLSNGTVVRKVLDTHDYETAMPSFTLRRMPDKTAESLLEKASVFFSTPRETSSRLTDPDNLYFYDGEQFHAWSSLEPAPDDFLKLFAEFDDAYNAAGPAEAFYLHEYFQPVNASTVAVHVFADGTVVFSRFDKLSYRMTSTSISKLPDADIAKTKDLAAAAETVKPVPYVKCPAATGLEYGVVEFVHGGQAQKTYTCSTENGEVAALFNHVKKFSSGE